jgi:hypothetical protein
VAPKIRRTLSFGAPARANGRELIPIARVWKLRFPGVLLGGVWSRPVAVLVREQDGSETIYPIPDLTRRAQVSILLLTCSAALFMLRRVRRRGR